MFHLSLRSITLCRSHDHNNGRKIISLCVRARVCVFCIPQMASSSATLTVEKDKSEGLLQTMFPDMITRQLREDLASRPQRYCECVTLYFSDIVAFDRICADSNPQQIVMLLSKMYW